MAIDTGVPRIRFPLHDLPMCLGRTASQSSCVCSAARNIEAKGSAQLPAGLAAGLPAKTLAPRAPQCLFECTMYNPDTYHHIIVCIWFFLQHPLKVQLGIFHLSRLADLPLPFPREPKLDFPRAT
jgi:hypothetical protein